MGVPNILEQVSQVREHEPKPQVRVNQKTIPTLRDEAQERRVRSKLSVMLGIAIATNPNFSTEFNNIVNK